MTALRVVLFDLDDTLFDHRKSVDLGVAAHRAAALAGAPAGSPDDLDAELERWHELEELHYHRYLAGEIDFLEQRRERARGFAHAYGVDLADPDAASAWFDGYLAEYERTWALHADALPSLDRIAARGLRVGIITNGELGFQTAKIRSIALADRLEHVIASHQVGVTKPDARIFHLACGVFGVEPGEAMYVGDRLRTDAVGAARAGLRGVWIDRRAAATDAERDEADDAGARIIRSLDQLDELLD